MGVKSIFRGGCLCCPGTQDTLPMDTVLYNGFGGYHVTHNGECVYSGDPNGDWESFKTMAQVERQIRRKGAAGEWRVILMNPLRGATWERRRGKWHLIETNQGFA